MGYAVTKTIQHGSSNKNVKKNNMFYLSGMNIK